MKTLKWQNLILFLVAFSFLCDCQNRNMNTDEISLWPAIEPFRSGYLKVSDIHEIYYKLCDNSKEKPFFVIHGELGVGCSPYMRQFFNPDKFLIVLYDQRGSGKSRPNAKLCENTIQELTIIKVNYRRRSRTFNERKTN
jgi:pimeloyl-ACP methyl ester carboxylesterase